MKYKGSSTVRAAARRASRRSICGAGMSALALLLCPIAASAQVVERGTSVTDLPRPGYEPHNIRMGSTVLSPKLDLTGVYDTNVYATSTNASDDYIFTIAPGLDALSTFGSLQLKSDSYWTRDEYADHGTESRSTYGGGTRGNFIINQAQKLTFGARFDRFVQTRFDPEGQTNINIKPRRFNTLAADLGYRYQRNRIGISVDGGVEKNNFISAIDADRDLTTYRGAVKVGVRVSGGTDVFVQGFVNRRDSRLAVDFTGVDRDATTLGALAGVSFDLGKKLQGSMGGGLFRSNNDDVRLRDFTGLAVNGRLTWSPDERTAITLAASRGDVGTVRAGASGRIDTNVTLQLDQEVRHNLLFLARAGVRGTTYRGTGSSQRQTTAVASGEVEYLLNRYMSAVVTGTYMKRWSKIALEDFEKGRVGVGLRLKY